VKLGRDADGVAQTEADHFGKCPVCGALVDMRDLAQVMANAHGQEIEELDAPPPDS
jgi:hypothetical protein